MFCWLQNTSDGSGGGGGGGGGGTASLALLLAARTTTRTARPDGRGAAWRPPRRSALASATAPPARGETALRIGAMTDGAPRRVATGADESAQAVAIAGTHAAGPAACLNAQATRLGGATLQLPCVRA